MVWPMESRTGPHLRSVMFIEVHCTVGFSWGCLLKRTVGIDAAHAISRCGRRSDLASLADAISNWSEMAANLIFGRTHSASRADRMTQIFFPLKPLWTCESTRILLRQRTGEWTGNIVRAGSRPREEVLGPSVGVEWVQHRVANVIASIRPRTC